MAHGARQLTIKNSVDEWVDDYSALWRKVKIENLLSHTCGISEHALIAGLRLTRNKTREGWYRIMSELPLAFALGTRLATSHSNYLLRGEVIHKVTGIDAREAIQETVIERAGMTTTVWRSTRAFCLSVRKGITSQWHAHQRFAHGRLRNAARRWLDFDSRLGSIRSVDA